ncbi:MAG: hypothetical protein NWR72_14045 [Bacteroidia bacterium]|nr:hypothetical protein [Bacteroidia bacterium]
MWHDLFPLNFTESELKDLNALEGRELSQVFYTVWNNLSAKGGDFQALDWVELFFADGHEIAFTAGEESDGLRVTELNFGLEQTRIQQQFNGQVMLQRLDVSSGAVWQAALGKKLLSVGMLEGPDGLIQNNQLQLNFSGVVMELALNEEGMLVRRQER